jgi:hypothetical protein
MKADGKSAKGGSDQDDKEDLGEASRGSNRGPRKRSEDRFGRRRQFWRKGELEFERQIAKEA